MGHGLTQIYIDIRFLVNLLKKTIPKFVVNFIEYFDNFFSERFIFKIF